MLIFNGRLLYPSRKLPSIWANSLSAVCGGGEGKPCQQLRATMQQERRVRGASVRQKLRRLLVCQSLGCGSAGVPSYPPGNGSMQRYGRVVQGWGAGGGGASLMNLSTFKYNLLSCNAVFGVRNIEPLYKLVVLKSIFIPDLSRHLG